MSTAQLCNICDCSKPENEDWNVKMTTNCTHTRSSCNECIIKHIREEITGKQLSRSIPCLQTGCGNTMAYANVQAFAPDDLFQQYDKQLTKKAIESFPEFRYCSAPNCGWGAFFDDGSNNPVIRCKKCSSKTCYNHRVVFHDGFTCQQYDESIANSEVHANKHYLDRHTKKCPSCHIPIEKNEGCDHMTCGGCHYEFCWLCMADYNGERGIRKLGNNAHSSSCRHYA
ncbi:hypothetical protein RCL1_006424 [Eukaryota sp. TZLM3-RCL]